MNSTRTDMQKVIIKMMENTWVCLNILMENECVMQPKFALLRDRNYQLL